MLLAYSEWEENSASDEMKKLHFWGKEFSTVPHFFEYFALFSMRGNP
jgi:hypothetical protein